MSTPLRILFGMTGGIAAYKAVSVIRGFVRDGHEVNVIATEAALNFIGRPTLEALSRNPVHVGLYDDVALVRHVALGQQADVVVIAPATANTIASIAAGLAPDLLGNAVLARRGPLVIAPAMHTEMWENAATVHNIRTLANRGVHIVGPAVGALTGEDSGVGRMVEPDAVVAATYAAVAGVRAGDLTGVSVLVSGGGTREPLDPVRFLGNRSSGKQAVALAERARDRGARVTLVGAHLEVEPPPGVAFISVGTARELRDAMIAQAPAHDVVVMAAAVADYRPESSSDKKLKKKNLGKTATITLVQNPDVLVELARASRSDQTVIGFAAETEATKSDLLAVARKKLASKGCDMLVVNTVGWQQGFGADTNEVIILGSGGTILDEVSGPKLSVADRILDCVAP
jgi:phosphopantothenoylcysteine decarboxylase/phosphopantothenate--cysteine ligase